MAVTIVIEDETGVLAFSLLMITGILALFGQMGRRGSSMLRELKQLVSDVQEAVKFVCKVLLIAVVSLEYGLGSS
jgi:hypothetical protein